MIPVLQRCRTKNTILNRTGVQRNKMLPSHSNDSVAVVLTYEFEKKEKLIARHAGKAPSPNRKQHAKPWRAGLGAMVLDRPRLWNCSISFLHSPDVC